MVANTNLVAPPIPTTQRVCVKRRGNRARSRVSAVRSGEVLTKRECAQLMRVSSRTLERLALVKQGPPSIRVGRQRRYLRESVMQWLAQAEAR